VAVAFDAVGPAGGGGATGSTTPISWSHIATGSNLVMLAAFSLDDSITNVALSSVSYGSQPMSLVGTQSNNNQAQGYLAVYKLLAPTAGTANVTATMSPGTTVWSGGSITFTGADQTTGFGAPPTPTFGSSSSGSITIASSTSGNLCAGFIGCGGNGISSTTSPSTSRWVNNVATGGSGGPSGGATSPSTGSAVTMAWGVNAEWWSVIALEVLAAATTPVVPTERQVFARQAVKRATLW
jgi:hypothetical protein